MMKASAPYGSPRKWDGFKQAVDRKITEPVLTPHLIVGRYESPTRDVEPTAALAAADPDRSA
jgi:tyrosine-protein phosphatase YwqE